MKGIFEVINEYVFFKILGSSFSSKSPLKVLYLKVGGNSMADSFTDKSMFLNLKPFS